MTYLSIHKHANQFSEIHELKINRINAVCHIIIGT